MERFTPKPTSGAVDKYGIISKESWYWHWIRRDKVKTTISGKTRRGVMAAKAEHMHGQLAQAIDRNCARVERSVSQREDRRAKRAQRKALKSA